MDASRTDDLCLVKAGKARAETSSAALSLSAEQGGGTGPLLSALLFAAEKHHGSLRKNSGPYINHPIAVAELLANSGGVSDVAVLQAAVLHDVLEDTPTPRDEITRRFGEIVCSLVLEVTDDMTLPKAKRKALQIQTAPHLSLGAKLIRIADKIANVRDITPDQPLEWTFERKREYLDWAEQVVTACCGCNPPLERQFRLLVVERRATLLSAG